MVELSVVVSFLDAAPFLAEAIESIFSQTYRHWEIVLVDDGSTDKSSAIAMAFAQRHPERVRYLEHPDHANRGISASRNLGVAQSRGELIAFLDADDCYLPERLERHVDILARHPELGMVQSNALRWFSWEQNSFADRIGSVPASINQVLSPPALLEEALANDPEAGWFPCTCSVTLRKSAIEEVGGFEDGFPRLCEDWVFWQKIYAHKKVYVTPDIVARYRKHRGSVLHQASNDFGSVLGPRFQAHVQYLRWLRSYLQMQKAQPSLLRQVERQLWPEQSPLLREGLGLPPALRLASRTLARRTRRYLRAAARQGLAVVKGLAPALKPARPRPEQ